ncbi:hypothetical protein [Flavobacterium sp. LHD-85]|uniref:hypothetical protein n=1 Tax=Flavobacterium sp. LHD-85 TaxID=3071410 RepID=UPI0027E1225E|nr:hypothetical protein [Flavobacterium sp. LHD-85]MDQ6528088.1 hypothetical protein [Flavobacterium sp. LHD-85]
MGEIIFDYKLDLKVVESERKAGNIREYDIDWLKGICNGRIFIFFDSVNSEKRNFMLLETGIIDYLLQFENMFSYKEEPDYVFSLVSCDYYSNSNYFKYTLPDNLEIKEGNGGIYVINCKYSSFKKSYENFRKKVIGELIVYYPELLENNSFKDIFLK